MPEISVIMPVYNAEPYLREAIESILAQTFSDFEFLILNDASTDKSEQIILSFNDPRIVYLKNEKNLGLIKTLNKGINLCKGRFVARMDNDDRAEAKRFEIQLNYLNNDPRASMACSPIIGITPAGKKRDHWPTDIKVKTAEQIRQTLPWENCIVHPSVMIRREVLSKYAYSQSQKGSEDWDLWLRLTRDGHKIIKTDEVLLWYRIHEFSMTSSHNRQQSPQIKSAYVKLRFAWESLLAGRFNGFVLKTLGTLYKDLGYDLKKRVFPKRLRQVNWLVTISPVAAFRQYTRLKKILSSQKPDLLLFFPYSHLGGAEKVHGQIVKAIEDLKPLVFFTGLHNSDDHRSLFGNNVTLLNIAAACYHPVYAKRTELLLTQYINSQPKPRLFGCNNDFFYRLILQIRKDVFVADLVHDIQYKENSFAEKHLVNYLRCNSRIFVSNKAKERTLEFYDKNFVDDEFKHRVKTVYNFSELPSLQADRTWKMPFEILYVGRDTPEKRVPVLADFARLASQHGLPLTFIFVGPDKSRYPELENNTVFTGVVTDPLRLASIYSKAHFILIGSSSEGFPLSVVEGMQNGCVPVCTAVGDIPFHVKEGFNGFLITGRDVGAEAFLKKFENIIQNKNDLEKISEAAKQYSRETFSREQFIKEYRELLS